MFVKAPPLSLCLNLHINCILAPLPPLRLLFIGALFLWEDTDVRGDLTCNGGQELNSTGNCFNLSVIEFAPTRTLTRGPRGHACTWNYIKLHKSTKETLQLLRCEYCYSMETRVVILRLSTLAPPPPFLELLSNIFVLSRTFFFFLVICVYCLDLTAFSTNVWKDVKVLMTGLSRG